MASTPAEAIPGRPTAADDLNTSSDRGPTTPSGVPATARSSARPLRPASHGAPPMGVPLIPAAPAAGRRLIRSRSVVATNVMYPNCAHR